jgi:hypothetical protein
MLAVEIALNRTFFEFTIDGATVKAHKIYAPGCVFTIFYFICNLGTGPIS